MPTTCKCGPCTHPAWKKPCAVKRSVTQQRAASTSATTAGDRKPWEAEPNRADGWQLLEHCGYGGDSAAATWRKMKRSGRFVPWPEALEALRELAKTRSNKTTINERRAQVIEELAAHLAGAAPSNGSAAASSTDPPPADLAPEEVPEDAPVSGDSPAEEVPNADSVAPPVSEERVELPQELAVLLDREGLPKVRRTPTGEYALMDIGMAITGKDAHDSAQDLRIVMDRYPEFATPEMGENLSHFHFQQRGPKFPTMVGKLAKVVEYIMLLPGKTAARVRVKAATILVRYLGGDLRLIDEVRRLRGVQEHLAEVDPEDWRRAFGEAVEQDAAAGPEKPVLLCSGFHLRVHEDVLPAAHRELGDLYLMHVGDAAGVLVAWKVGRSADPLQRAAGLDGEARRLLGKEGWAHGVADIVRGAGCLEPLVLRRLAELRLEDHREYFRPEEDFRGLFLDLCRATAPVWVEQRFQQKNRKSRGDEEDDFEARTKRCRADFALRREHAEVCHEELAVQERAFALYERKVLLSLSAAERRAALERSSSSVL
jgi:hypothetical protein